MTLLFPIYYLVRIIQPYPSSQTCMCCFLGEKHKSIPTPLLCLAARLLLVSGMWAEVIYAASEQKFQSQCVALPLFCPQSTEQSDGRERGTLRGGGEEEKRRKEQLCRLGRRRDGFCQGQKGSGWREEKGREYTLAEDRTQGFSLCPLRNLSEGWNPLLVTSSCWTVLCAMHGHRHK